MKWIPECGSVSVCEPSPGRRMCWEHFNFGGLENCTIVHVSKCTFDQLAILGMHLWARSQLCASICLCAPVCIWCILHNHTHIYIYIYIRVCVCVAQSFLFIKNQEAFSLKTKVHVLESSSMGVLFSAIQLGSNVSLRESSGFSNLFPTLLQRLLISQTEKIPWMPRRLFFCCCYISERAKGTRHWRRGTQEFLFLTQSWVGRGMQNFCICCTRRDSRTLHGINKPEFAPTVHTYTHTHTHTHTRIPALYTSTPTLTHYALLIIKQI